MLKYESIKVHISRGEMAYAVNTRCLQHMPTLPLPKLVYIQFFYASYPQSIAKIINKEVRSCLKQASKQAGKQGREGTPMAMNS